MTTSRRKLDGISAVLCPASVVVIGASTRRASSGNEAISNLIRSKYPRDRLYVVHPSASTIDGLPVTNSIAQLPEAVDLALLSLPASAVLPALMDLEQRGCRAAIVPTAGFDESQTAELEAFLATSNLVLHGHNCMGVLNVADGVPLWFYDGLLTELPAGPISIVSQSGSATFLARATEDIGFARIVSTGNETDLSTTDYLTWLASDPETKVVGIVIESISSVSEFEQAIRMLRAAGKPAVVLKVGRTELGKQATQAHTGALIGSDDSYLSLFDRLDLPIVGDYDQMAVTLQLLATPGMPRAQGPRIAVLTDSGGEAGLAADLAERVNATVPPFDSATVSRLSELMPGTTMNNPFDVGANPVSDDAYNEAFTLAAADPGIDSVMIVVETHASMNDMEIEYAGEMMSDAIAAACNVGKPVAVVCSSSSSTHPGFRKFLDPSVPVLRGIDNAYVALAASAKNYKPVANRDLPRPTGVPSSDELVRLQASVGACSGVLPHALTNDLLASYGLNGVPTQMISCLAELAELDDFEHPVVVKVCSRDIPHRSDVGGVITGISNSSDLRAAVDSIQVSVSKRLPFAVIDGFEIQKQIVDAHEAVLGFVSDPIFGSTVTVGSGGVLVELLADSASAPAPISIDEAADRIERTVMGQILNGYRHLHPETDLGELIDTLVRFSWLAHDFSDYLEAADLNPVLVEYGSGSVSVVDALLIATGSVAQPQASAGFSLQEANV